MALRVLVQAEAEAAAYLAGMIDGEGTVSRIGEGRRVRIGSTTPELIEACIEACDVLGIATIRHKDAVSASKRGRIPYHLLSITGRTNLERLQQTVPLRHPEKRARLDAIVTTYVQGFPLTEEELLALYHEQSLSPTQIGRLIGRDAKTVWCHLRQTGKPMRSGSEALRAAYAAGRR